ERRVTRSRAGCAAASRIPCRAQARGHARAARRHEGDAPARARHAEPERLRGAHRRHLGARVARPVYGRGRGRALTSRPAVCSSHRTMVRLSTLSTVWTLVLAACSTITTRANVPYDDRFASDVLDIYLPPPVTTPRPAVLVIHGGGWH